MSPYSNHIIELLSGDGKTRTFPLDYPIVDLVHDPYDPFCDSAIFRSDPKIEYPLGRRRWAVSHSYLCYPITDSALYDKEYTWDAQANTITTHFHEHVTLEPARTDESGLQVKVAHRPISTGVYTRANHFSQRCSSAVRGVWDNPEKEGRNYYSRRAVILTGPKLIFYFQPAHEPVVNQLGIWEVEDSEQPERFFDAQGLCTAPERLIEDLRIPLHEPKILVGSQRFEALDPQPKFFETDFRQPAGWANLVNNFQPVPSPDYLEPVLGSTFVPGFVGYAAHEAKHVEDRPPEHEMEVGYSGFRDINDDGRIDEWELDFLREHQGEIWRVNAGAAGYFGIGWLSPGFSIPITEAFPYHRYIAAYDYGGGYDADAGVIHLLDSPGANKEVFIEYHYDAPAAAGKDNIKVYLHV